ncbi:MAG: HNH endonuclease signature motif containing protein [Dehalococcoidales bacterium]|nr:HNH endonuclease signature motif containing protein [Dehalococcoidales bacterium]
MTLIDYAIIAAAMVIVTLVVGAASMAVRKLQNAGRPTGETPSGGASDPQINIEIQGTDPLRDLSRLPELGNSSTLPDEAKSALMNAVWYRCENPKCNYTQFLDVYQIASLEKGGSNALENLVVLCPECRNIAESGQIDDDILRSWIQGRLERFKFALDWPYK